MVGSVLEDLRKQYAPQTPTTEHAAADQKAHKTAVLLLAMFAFVAFMLLFLLMAPFAQEMREEKPAQTLAPYHTAGKHQAHETAFLVPAALLPVLFSAFLVLTLLLSPLTQNVSEQEAADSPPAHDAATN
jgi:flagellar biosynthesis/type III secretory pathway M-ring protein FliF/YscJ